MTNERKTLEAQMEIARARMVRHREVYAALANPEGMSDDMKASIEAAKPTLEKYRARRKSPNAD